MSRPPPVTARQVEVLEEILSFARLRGYMPTVRELGDGLGISLHGAYCHLLALEAKGLITRARGTARSIVITKAGRRELSGSWEAA